MVFNPSSVITAIGLATSVAGLVSGQGDEGDRIAIELDQQRRLARTQAGLSNQISLISEDNERIRQAQAGLEFQRRTRDVVRAALQQQATARNNAANAGALQSSAASGAQGQAAGTAGIQLRALSENFGLGQDLFANNFEILGLQRRQTDLQTQFNESQQRVSTLQGDASERAQRSSALFQTGQSLVANSQSFGNAITSIFG